LLSFLPTPPISKTTYTAVELDFTRAYVVLAHAEIESFCEDVAGETMRKARDKFDKSGLVTPVLRRILAYYVGKNRRSWSDVAAPTQQIIASAESSYRDGLRANHGVKRDNLEKLFYPLGVAEPNLDSVWLAQMDSFGTNRGGWAHKSIKALNPPDPLSELTNVRQLLVGLLQVDRLLGRLR
jgi:hypothetical protein